VVYFFAVFLKPCSSQSEGATLMPLMPSWQGLEIEMREIDSNPLFIFFHLFLFLLFGSFRLLCRSSIFPPVFSPSHLLLQNLPKGFAKHSNLLTPSGVRPEAKPRQPKHFCAFLAPKMHLVKTILCRFEMVLIIYANYFILTLLLYKTMCNRN